MTYNFTGDYKAKFNEEVTNIIRMKIADRTERMVAIERLTDAYGMQTGEKPDAAQLERLTNEILREELTSTYRDKAKEPYSFLSERQLTTRHNGEISIKAAEEVGLDGRNHKAPKRRKRNTYENTVIDRKAKIRNKERKEQYKRDTAPGPVITYNLSDIATVN